MDTKPLGLIKNCNGPHIKDFACNGREIKNNLPIFTVTVNGLEILLISYHSPLRIIFFIASTSV